MKSSAKKIELASVDDLFSTEEGRQDAKLEKIQEIPLSELHPFKNHPFKVKDDEAMMETADSIKQYGVLVPAIVLRQRLLQSRSYRFLHAGHAPGQALLCPVTGDDLAGLIRTERKWVLCRKAKQSVS